MRTSWDGLGNRKSLGFGELNQFGEFLGGVRWWGMGLSIFAPSFGVQDFHPFDPLTVVSGGMDGHVKIWSLEGVGVGGEEGSWKLPAGLRRGFWGFGFRGGESGAALPQLGRAVLRLPHPGAQVPGQYAVTGLSTGGGRGRGKGGMVSVLVENFFFDSAAVSI